METEAGERIPAGSVVFNGDARRWRPACSATAEANGRRPTPARRSLSAAVSCRFVATEGFPLTRHNVFFQDGYAQEFADIFGRRRMPERPTVNVCAQDRGDEASAPPAPSAFRSSSTRPPNWMAACPPEKEIDRWPHASDAGHGALRPRLSPGPATLTGPREFAALFPGTGGAIYGQASHGMLSPFRRPGTRSRVPGLYLAGGSVHRDLGCRWRRCRVAGGRSDPRGPDFGQAVAPGGYAWWYVDALSEDGTKALTIIAFVGSVFSP